MKEVIVPTDDLVCLGKDKLQELVRCADCKYWDCGANDVEQWSYCLIREGNCDPTDFCSWAERNE